MSFVDSLVEKNLIPDFLIRLRIRKLLAQRLRDENKGSEEAQQKHLLQLVEELKNSPIAIHTSDANEQHYEVPTEFYKLALGKHLKYSSGYWKSGVNKIDQSEQDMLVLTCARAELTDGLDILELGCGWGSLTLFMAQRYPNSNITAVSNSRTQKEYIDDEAAKRRLNNVTIITADMNAFTIDKKFDRVVSVEMFEHMRNYKLLLQKVASFLKDDGKLFVHIFTHREYTYKFEVKDDTDWMSKYFFTGGIMPADRLLHNFNDNLKITKHWQIDGTHYAKTSRAWLNNTDAHKKEILLIFANTYGQNNALKWFVYWRIFFIACEELWNYKQGTEWLVSHYLFEKK